MQDERAGTEQNTGAGTNEAKPRVRWMRRGCGCFAFFLGAGLTFLFFLPQLLGRTILQELVDEANAEIAGEFELGDVSLSWTAPQHLEGLRLRDHKGRTVADLDLVIPSIWQMGIAAIRAADGVRGDFGVFRGTAEVALVTAPGEPNNLQRALAPSAAGRRAQGLDADAGTNSVVIVKEDAEGGNNDIAISFGSNVDWIAIDMALDVKHFSWSDPRIDAGGRAVGVKDLMLRVVAEPGEPMRLTIRGEHFHGEAKAPLAVDLRIDLTRLEYGLEPFEAMEGHATLEAVPTALVDHLLEADGELLAALGPKFGVEVGLRDALGGGRTLTLTLDSEREHLELEARVVDGMLRVAEDEPLVLDLQVPRAVLDAVLARELPEGTTLVLPATSVPVHLEVDRFSIPLAAGGDWRAADAALRLTIPTIGVRHEGAPDLELSDGRIALSMEPSGSLHAELGLHEASGGDLRVVLELPTGWYDHISGDVPGNTLEYRAQLDLNDLPPERVHAFFAPDDPLVALLTDPIHIGIESQPIDWQTFGVNLKIVSGKTRVMVFGQVREDEVRVLPERAGVIALDLAPDQLARIAGDSWPADLELASPTGRVTAQIFLRELHWPLDGGLGTATVELNVDVLSITNDALRAAGESLEIGSISTKTSVAPLDPLSVDATLILADRGGTVSLKLRSEESLTQLDGGAEPTLRVELAGADLPTALIDALAEQDGLLLDVLGPAVQLDAVVTEWRSESAVADVELTSDNAHLTWSGQLADGVLRSTGDEQSLDAHVGLTPLFQERIIGKLVPVLVAMEQVDGARPARLTVTEFRMPLAAEDESALEAMEADVRLELGELRCAVLPDLAQLFSSQVHTLRPTTLPPLDLKLRGGRVFAESIPFEIEQTPVEFSGYYSLLDDTMDFTCSVPLQSLRGDVGRALNDARAYLDPNLLVPLHIHGNSKRPSVGIRSGFLEGVLRDSAEKVIEDTLEKELEKGLRKLFGDH